MDNSFPRKILMTTDALGGVWNYALELARALEAHDVEIALATMGPPPNAAQQRVVHRLPNVSLFEGDFRLEWMDEPWTDVDRAGDWLLEIASGFRPELIHLNGYSHAVLNWNAPVVVVAHSCVVSWWRAVKGEEPPTRYAEYRRRVAAGLAAADLVVAPTAAMLGSLHANYGFNRRGVVIPNGRDASVFVPAEKRPVIFTAGRAWDEAKNISALNAIAPELPWPILVAGEPEHPNGRITALPNLRCLGTLTQLEMAHQLGAASIFALPARYEPFGLSILEAGLSECTLVLGDIPSLRETWEDAAIFVQPDDHPQIAAIINNLITSPNQRKRLEGRARDRALQFSSEQLTSAYADAYRECAAAKVTEAAA